MGVLGWSCRCYTNMISTDRTRQPLTALTIQTQHLPSTPYSTPYQKKPQKKTTSKTPQHLPSTLQLLTKNTTKENQLPKSPQTHFKRFQSPLLQHELGRFTARRVTSTAAGLEGYSPTPSGSSGWMWSFPPMTDNLLFLRGTLPLGRKAEEADEEREEGIRDTIFRVIWKRKGRGVIRENKDNLRCGRRRRSDGRNDTRHRMI